MSHYPNPHQPKRPSVCPDDGVTDLQYRTHVSHPRSQFRVYQWTNIVAQTLLYRWASHEFVNHVSQTELYEYLFHDYDQVSKKNMGAVINQALRYDPRILKGKSKSNPKARFMMSFHSRFDLIYGLEWMMSFWLRKLDPDMDLISLFEEISACEDATLGEMFWTPVVEMKLYKQEPNWIKFWREYNCEEQGPLRTKGPRPVLKSMI